MDLNQHPALLSNLLSLLTFSKLLCLFHPSLHSQFLLALVTLIHKGASLMAQMVKNLSAMQETRVQSLGQEDTLEKDIATHSSILSWRTPGTEGPGGLQSMASQRVRHD